MTGTEKQENPLTQLAVYGNYDNLWQSMAVSGIQLAVIANSYQPERRRREGQLRTPHDPSLNLYHF